MSHHIEASPEAISSTVLFPGDPLRAKFIAETYFEAPTCYNQVRGMLGYTGTYKGRRLSVQGSGMGMPSMMIYAHELIHSYGVKTLVRVGSCGAYQEKLNLKSLVLAQAACTDSHMNRLTFQGMDFAPIADFHLLSTAAGMARERQLDFHVGNVLASDRFYNESDPMELWARHGVLAVEMETSGLYTIAAREGIRALAILSVSDHLKTGAFLSAEDRQTSFTQMIELALDTVIEAVPCH